MKGLWGKVWVRGLVTAVAAVIMHGIVVVAGLLFPPPPLLTMAPDVLDFAGGAVIRFGPLTPVLAIGPLWVAVELCLRHRAPPAVLPWIAFAALFAVLGSALQWLANLIWLMANVSAPYILFVLAAWLLATGIMGFVAKLWFDRAQTRRASADKVF